MKRKTPVNRAKPAAPASREVLLAGLGAVSLGRKQVIQSYTDAVSKAYRLRDRANAAVNAASAKAAKLRKQAQSRLAPASKTVLTLVSELRSQARAQLTPVLGKLGLATAKTAAIRTGRKPAAAKRAPAKVAKRSRKAA